jgi:hypothetical protein
MLIALYPTGMEISGQRALGAWREYGSGKGKSQRRGGALVLTGLAGLAGLARPGRHQLGFFPGRHDRRFTEEALGP